MPARSTVTPRSNTTADEFKRMVLRAKEYIAAGDIFQVVLSQRFEAPFALPPFALYRALRRVNPSPYLFFLDFGDFAVAGSSPEILVKTSDGTVTIRPIAGTRRRGATPHEDKALEAGAAGRSQGTRRASDAARSRPQRCRPRRRDRHREVTDQFFIERYSQVMHIVSNVEGKLRSDRDPLDALAAGFPAGTVSGAPKVRAMQIIDELEKEKRALYAGCVGYFSAGADMDTCIVLRTALIKDGVMYVQAGAGIVADSDPEFEQQECINKAKALFRAAEEAKRFASAANGGGSALALSSVPSIGKARMSEVISAEIVSFWREAGPERWFEKDDDFDLTITSRFLAIHEAAARGELAAFEETRRRRARAGHPVRSVSPEHVSQRCPRVRDRSIGARRGNRAIARGFDQATEQMMRPFFYLPFMHSE